MESLKRFEWFRDPAGYRLAWFPSGRSKAYWSHPSDHWSGPQSADRSIKLDIDTKPEKARQGLYIAGYRYDVNARKGSSDGMASREIIRPFANDELVSRNLLETEDSPRGWLDFTNKYGLIGRTRSVNSSHLTGRDKRWFIYEVEHEGQWHHLRRTLFKIYNYYPAIQKRDKKYLAKFIQWDSAGVVREDEGIWIGRAKIRMAIAIKGLSRSHYFEHMKKPDVLTPAAFALRFVNRYLRDGVSVEVDFDTSNFNFSSKLGYSSFGAALVAEAVEFMAGHFEARQCKVCGSWFRIGADQKRRDRVFCSAACKMRNYRARRVSA